MRVLSASGLSAVSMCVVSECFLLLRLFFAIVVDSVTFGIV